MCKKNVKCFKFKYREVHIKFAHFAHWNFLEDVSSLQPLENLVSSCAPLKGGDKMTIRKISSRKPRYIIEDDNRGTVAYFDSLYSAGVVMRYLSGAVMHKKDAEAAQEAMREFDLKEHKAERK